MKKLLSLIIILFLSIQPLGYSAGVEIIGEVDITGKSFIGNKILTEASLWLDAADIDTITLVGSDVSVWADKGSNGNDASQSMAVRRPAYDTSGALPVINFDNIDDYLNIINLWTSAFTLFIVTTKTVNDSTDQILSGEGAHLFTEYSGKDFEWYNTTNERKLIKESTDNNLHLITVRREDDGILQCFFDGAIVVDSTAYADADLLGLELRYIGSNGTLNYANVDIGEIMIFDKLLSVAERQIYESYLMDKWGI